MAKIDTASMVPAEDVDDEDAEEKRLLRERAHEARGFLAKFRWCCSIRKLWFAGGFSVDAAKNGRSVADCIPVNVAATPDNAKILESRLDFIEKEYVPLLP